ncbi:MAG TPA: hypothetical protein VGQ62_20050 [Chloroflexota bacterium]|nr:hypothetical protein [Chloroflexota bacterium]
MTEVLVPDFLPSTRGLHFCNYYPHEPTIQVHLPLGRTIGFGDAANGLCGGMAYVVRDFYEAGRVPPPVIDPPPAGTPLYQFIVQRLLESFSLPFGLARYLELMEPAFPDVGLGFGLPGRASVMLNAEWPRIKADLDAGHPVPLGLIKVKSADPCALCQNHQVLAYGYDISGTDLTLRLYDPNYPNRDDVTLSLSIASPQVAVPLTYNPAEQVYCFFHTAYTFREPPVL